MSKILNRQSLVGKVLSSKMSKTVTVQVTRVIPHPVYKKRLKKYKKYLSHVANVVPNNGDVVKIISIRPMSKKKRWLVAEILQKSKVID